MKRILACLFVAAFVISLVTSVAAATWVQVGTSGFSTTPSLLQDHERIKLGSVTIDGSGNVYAACNNLENGVYNYERFTSGFPIVGNPGSVVTFSGTNQGGITIFRPGFSPLNVKLSDFTDGAWIGKNYPWGPDFPVPPDTARTDNKITGGITKLVTAGNGDVFALVNWQEISWDTNKQNHRIVKIGPDGTVTHIWSPGPARSYLYVNGTSYSWDAGSTGNRIRGIAVGGDGNVYWTMDGSDGYWKTHFLWRYNIVQNQVEEAPINNANQGWGQVHRMFDLAYVGEPGDDGGYFAVLYSGGAEWAADPIAWNKNRLAGVLYSASNPAWSRNHVTCVEYDPNWKKLWVAGRSGGSGPYAWHGEGTQSVTWTTAGSDEVLRFTKAPAGKVYYGWTEGAAGFTDADKKLTMEARFRVNSATADFTGAMFVLIGKNTPSTILRIIADRFRLVDVDANLIADLGPKDANWHTLRTVVNGDAMTAQAWWDGSPVTINPPASWRGINKRVWFGVSAQDSSWTWGGNMNGSAEVDFDRVRFARAIVTPSDAWPAILGGNIDNGPLYPDEYANSSVMSRWNGDLSLAGGLFYEISGAPKLPLVHPETVLSMNADMAHVNGSDPYVTGVPNNGRCWVSTIAVNPNDGNAWMSLGASASYNYDEIGTVWAYTLGMGKYSEGVPETGAQVVALKFDDVNDKVYALTCNMTSGAYKLYRADAPQVAQVSISDMKTRTIGQLFETDTPKVVTHTDLFGRYFYIEDDDRTAGIKVVPMAGQPVGNIGERVTIKGYTSNQYWNAGALPARLETGEAFIYAAQVTATPTTDKIEPFATAIKNIGGAQKGMQAHTIAADPAKDPSFTLLSGLNTTGLLLRVTGTVSEAGSEGFYLDDGSGYRIWVSYIYDDRMDGEIIGITGVSGVMFDGANGVRCILSNAYPHANVEVYN